MKILECVKAAQQGHTTAGYNALLDSGTSGVERVNNAILMLCETLRYGSTKS